MRSPTVLHSGRQRGVEDRSAGKAALRYGVNQNQGADLPQPQGGHSVSRQNTERSSARRRRHSGSRFRIGQDDDAASPLRVDSLPRDRRQQFSHRIPLLCVCGDQLRSARLRALSAKSRERVEPWTSPTLHQLRLTRRNTATTNDSRVL